MLSDIGRRTFLAGSVHFEAPPPAATCCIDGFPMATAAVGMKAAVGPSMGPKFLNSKKKG